MSLVALRHLYTAQEFLKIKKEMRNVEEREREKKMNKNEKLRREKR